MGSICFVWVPIPAGEYEMGCEEGEPYCEKKSRPKHPVRVAKFELMETEVTERQWAFFMPDYPQRPCPLGRLGSGEFPVFSVPNFDAANEFCARVGGRLPTEAEWEYAARAGSSLPFMCGETHECLDEYEWWMWEGRVEPPLPDGNLRPVRQKKPNAFGLYDMLGNATEFVSDCAYETYDGAPSEAYPPWGPCEGVIASSRIARGTRPFLDFEPRPVYHRRAAPRHCFHEECCLGGVRCARPAAN